MTPPRDFWRLPRGPFTEAVIAAAVRHATEQAPKEACGLVVGGAYVRCRNYAAKPEERFKISAKEMARKLAGRPLEGVIHSHPRGGAAPSEADMRAQIASGAPWAIVSTTGLLCSWGLENPPLFEGREHNARTFCHGASDCYTLIRDWWRETRGVVLPDFPRAREWWADPDKHGSLYLDNMAAAGFRLVSTDPTQFARLARPGDVALRRVLSKIPNHGAVVLPAGLMLDQRVGCLSGRHLAARLLPVSTHLLRHESES